jgi:hypothetical protein
MDERKAAFGRSARTRPALDDDFAVEDDLVVEDVEYGRGVHRMLRIQGWANLE